MKKIFYILPFLFMGTAINAQVIEDSDPEVAIEEQKEAAEEEAEKAKEELKIAKEELKEVKEEAKEAKEEAKKSNAAIDDAQKSYKEAQEAYQEAQKTLAEARQAEMKAENELERSRTKMRQAKLSVADAKKRVNPLVIDRYEVNINPIYEEMSKGMNAGLSTFIEGSKTSNVFNVFSKNVDKEFKDYMKQFNSSKVKKQKGELFFDNIMIPEMSASTMDLFVDFDKQENGVSIRTYFNDGAEFIDFQDEDAIETRYATRLMDQFARYIRTKQLEEELENLEKELNKNQKDLESNKKDISKAKEDVQKAKSEIVEKTNEISTFENNIDDLNEKLDITREKLSKVN